MKRENKMQVDIIIDKLTDCLVERETKAVVKTEYKKLELPIKKKSFIGWNFDWRKTQKKWI